MPSDRAAPRKHRCRPGYTHDPYECCGTAGESGYGRPKGQICNDCAKLIAEGREARAAKAQSGAVVRQWVTRDYGWPQFYGVDGDIPDEARSALSDAFFALANTVVVPAPGDTPNTDPATRRPGRHGWDDEDPWPFLLSRPEGRRQGDWSWKTLVLVRPEVQAALDTLYHAIWRALGATYHAGKAEGSSVLRQLASGDLSLTDFDEAMLTRAERERRRA